MSNYFPMGFVYPTGPNFTYSKTNPDPAIEMLEARVAFLNASHDQSSLPGHIFAAALKLIQERSAMDVEAFWDTMQHNFTPAEVSEMADAVASLVADEPPRLDFPNAIALVDCRFVSTLEWQHLRRYSIGGSEAAVVVGKQDENGDQINGFTQLSKFQTRRSLFHEKQATFAERPNSVPKQHIFDYGHCVEPYVIERAAKELGAKVYPEWRMFAHKDYPFITCNPDGILIFPDGSLCLFEAKTATYRKLDEWHEGIPEYYKPQPRQYMEVLNDPKISHGYIACCTGANRYDWVIHEYQRDPVLGKKQMEIEAAFWHDYIAAGVLPPLSGDPELDLQAVYGYDAAYAAAARTVSASTLPASCEPLLEEYIRLSGEKKTLSSIKNKAYEKEKNLKTAISLNVDEGLSVFKKANEVSYRVSYKTSTVERVDTSELLSADRDASYSCNALALALEDEKCEFGNPKIGISKPAKTKTKKVS